VAILDNVVGQNVLLNHPSIFFCFQCNTR